MDGAPIPLRAPVRILLDPRADHVRAAIHRQIEGADLGALIEAVLCQAGLILSDAAQLACAAAVTGGPLGQWAFTAGPIPPAEVPKALTLLRPESRHLVDVLMADGWIEIEGAE